MRFTHVNWMGTLALAVIVAFGITSCGGTTDDSASVSSIDSTLALSDISDAELTPEEEFSPPPARETPPPDPKPAPKPAPKPVVPKETTVMVPAGTALSMTLESPLTTKTAAVGDEFSAVVTSAIVVDNRVAIPEGSVVSGHVAATEQPGKISGRGMMQLAFNTLEFEGRRYTIASVGDTIWGEGGAKKDAAMIGGGAAVGAIIGGILGGKSGALKGAAAGGAAGTGASLATRGPQLELAAGEPLTVTLGRPVTVTTPPLGDS